MHILGYTAVHAHDFFIDESDQRNMVEAITESLKQWDFISSLDFIEEPVNSSNGLTLVISSQNDYLLGESYFQSE